MRNAESAGAPGSSSMRYRAPHFFSPGGAEYSGMGNCVTLAPAFQRGDLADAVLLHLVDAQHRMHGQKGALDPLEFALDALLGRVEHHGGTLAEQQLLDLDEAEQLPVATLRA